MGGAGALGSLLADNLVRQGLRQLHRREDVGVLKVDVLKAHCFLATSVEIVPIVKRLDEHNVGKFLRVVLRWVLEGRQENYAVTLRDLKISID